MMFDRTYVSCVVAIGLALSLGACKSQSGGDKKAESEEPKQEKQKQQDKEKEGSADKGSMDTKEVTLKPKGNKMKFAGDDTEFTVKAGQKIKLVFENTATSKAMKHNVNVLDTDDKKVVKDFSQKSLKAGKKEGYTDKDHERLLAYTALADPGETVETTFTAPKKAGKHTYVCTFPAHWKTMQGTMTVEK